MKSDARFILVFFSAVICVLGAFLLLDKTVEISRQTEDKQAVSDTFLKGTTPNFSSKNSLTPHLEPFDPNTASEAQLSSLGLSDFSVRCVVKYRKAGGVFRTKADFAKIYGISVEQYRLLEPYISLGEAYTPASVVIKEEKKASYLAPRDTFNYPKKLAEGEKILLNTADTNELKRVRGIGSYYARKIVELRSKYGGFVSLSQLNDIQNFPEESFAYFILNAEDVKKLDLNTADFRSLQAHPYIGYRRAQEIMNYRRLKGKISSLDDLSLLEGFSPQERERLKPYVEF